MKALLPLMTHSVRRAAGLGAASIGAESGLGPNAASASPPAVATRSGAARRCQNGHRHRAQGHPPPQALVAPAGADPGQFLDGHAEGEVVAPHAKSISCGKRRPNRPIFPIWRTIWYRECVVLVVLGDDRRDHLVGELGNVLRSASSSSLSIGIPPWWRSILVAFDPGGVRRRLRPGRAGAGTWRSLVRLGRPAVNSPRRSAGSRLSTTSSLASRTMSMSCSYSSRRAATNAARAAVGRAAILLAYTAFTAASAPITAIFAVGSAIVASGRSRGPPSRTARRRKPCAPPRRSWARSRRWP